MVRSLRGGFRRALTRFTRTAGHICHWTLLLPGSGHLLPHHLAPRAREMLFAGADDVSRPGLAADDSFLQSGLAITGGDPHRPIAAQRICSAWNIGYRPRAVEGNRTGHVHP